MRCPHCGARNPEGFQFCGHCGNPLSRAPLPQRRWATALFFDLTNFSRYTTAHDLEDTHHAVHKLLERARDCVTTHGGYVDKFFGDGMLAVFGLQKSRENEPLRALQAAACMVEATRGNGQELQGRVGLATGLVLLGPLGSEQGQHQTVIGTPVNLAQRLAASAPGGEVWLDQVTAQLIPEANLKGLKPRLFKGFREPQPVGVFQGWGRREHPLFGREEEIKRVLGWIGEAERGGGRVAVISGPIGAGKTFLVEEALRRSSSQIRTIHIPGVDVGSPVREILQQALARSLGMTPEAILAQLPLADLDRRALAFALGLESERPAPPEDLESTLARSFRRGLQYLATERPTVLVMRSGPHDHALLGRLLDELRSEPLKGLTVLVLKRSPAPGADLMLGPLSPRDADAYLRHLNPALDKGTREGIYRESGGFPLALRFLALSADPGASVMAAFQSRLDKLRPLHRKILLYTALGQPASWPGLLRELLNEEVDSAITDLVEDGYLVADTTSDEDATALRVANPLLQKAARLFLSKKDRLRLHEAYWHWLRNRPSTHYAAQAAEHARLAGRNLDAARAYLRAGDLQKEEGIFRGAEQYYQAALGYFPDENKDEARLRLAALHLEGGSPETALSWLEGQTSHEALKLTGLAQARLGMAKEARINLGRYLKARRGDPEVAMALLALDPPAERLERLHAAQPQGPPELRAAHARLLAESYAELGRYEEAARAMHSAYTHYMEARNESRAAEAALAISGHRWMAERLEAAAEWADRAVEHARKAHPGLATTAWSVRAGLWLDQGRASEAAAALEQAEVHLDHARTPNERARIHAIRMRYFIETGQLQQAIVLGESAYAGEPHHWLGANLALAYALRGGPDSEQRFRELQRRHAQETSSPGHLLFALSEALRIWRTGGNPIPVLKAARRQTRSSGPYLHYLTLTLWGLYLMHRKPKKALALAQHLQRRAGAGGFVAVSETARLLRAEIAMGRGEPVEHLLRFKGSLATQETWRQSLLTRLEHSGSAADHSLGGYGILGAWARQHGSSARLQETDGPS